MKLFAGKLFSNALFALVAIVLVWPEAALATGPRVTKSLFSADKSEIHTIDFPPYVSTEVTDGGAVSEIVRTALKVAGIEAVITTHPLTGMVRYYLLQEHALAVMGRHLQFSDEQKKNLIFIPLMVMEEAYFYYKPLHPDGLKMDTDSLKQMTYGAHRGEDVSRHEKAGTTVKYAATMTLLKLLKSGEVDYVAVPALSEEWLVDRYMADEKGNFARLAETAGNETLYMIFNRKHAGGEAAAQGFRKALADIIQDGTYGRILDKHLGVENGKLYLRRLETLQ